MGLSSFNFFSGGLRKTFFSTTSRFGRSRSSNFVDFGTNRQRVCDFLLVRLSNLGLILHCFRDISAFCARDPTCIPPYFWRCSRWTRSPMLGSARAEALSREIVIFKVFQPAWKTYLNATERRTEGRTAYCGLTALCAASRAKNQVSHIIAINWFR